jgi:apolipoprotein N-acyltransferase
MKPLLLFPLLIIFGAIQTLSMAPYNFWLLGPISIFLILLMSGLLDPKLPLTIRKSAIYGWLVGFGLFASGASWIYVSINTYGNAPPILAGILTFIFVAGLGLFHALVFALFAWLKNDNWTLNALTFSGLWLLGDGLRSVFLTGFPWLFLGDAHLASPLTDWIPVIGAYGVTFIVVLTGCVMSLITSMPSMPMKKCLVSGLIVIWLGGTALNAINWTEDTGESLSVAMIQSNIPQQLKWSSAQKPKTIDLLINTTKEHYDKDLIIWPETALPILYSQAVPLLKTLGKEAADSNTSIITGIPYQAWDRKARRSIMHNSVISFGTGSGINHKQKLVPFGEYVPLQKYLRGLIAFFDLPMSNFQKGDANQALLTAGNYHFAPFICYEVVYADFVAQRAENADFLLTISNDSWFGKSIGPLQHLALAQVRALENGRYMLRSTNNGVTAIINEKGHIAARAEQFILTTLTGEVKIIKGETPYTRFGSSPIFSLACFLVLIALMSRIKALRGSTPA